MDSSSHLLDFVGTFSSSVVTLSTLTAQLGWSLWSNVLGMKQQKRQVFGIRFLCPNLKGKRLEMAILSSGLWKFGESSTCVDYEIM